MFVEIGLLIFGLLTAFYLYCTRHFDYWKKRGIPYEKPIPFFGNLWDSIIFKRAAGDISTDTYRKFSGEKVVGMFHFDTPVLLIRDPKLVGKIYVSDFSHFANNSMVIEEHVDPVLSRNMFFQRDDKWKRTRQMLSPAFTAGKIKLIFETLESVAKRLKEHIEKYPEECELKYLMSRFTTEIVATAALGIDGRCFEDPKPHMVKIGQLIFEPGIINGLIQTAVIMMPLVSKIFHIKMVPKEVPKFFNGILRDVIQHRQTNPSYMRQDLIQHWIDLKKKSQEVSKGNVKSDFLNQELSDDDILAGCVTFFIESYETTSMVTSFALHYLALDAVLQERVKKEIEEVYEKCNGKLTLEAVTDMTLLNNIILEVLRLHPAVHHGLKSCTKTYNMDIGKSEPLVVEKDTIVVLPHAALGRDPLYWKDPEKFDPDRFDEMDKDEWKKKGIFLPFGDGPRICIGMRIAYTITKLSLIYMLKDFRVVPTAKTPKYIMQDPRHFISRSRDGLYAKFVKRG